MRFCERCGTGLVHPTAPPAVDTMDTERDIPAVVSAASPRPVARSIVDDVQEFLPTSEMDAIQPGGATSDAPDPAEAAPAAGHPHAMVALRLSSEERSAVAPKSVDVQAWEQWQGTHPIPSRLRVADQDWRCLARLDVADKESVRRFGFRIEEADNLSKEQGEGRYPGGAMVAGRGLRHRGGVAILTVPDLRVGAPVVMVRQSLAIGVELAEVSVGTGDDLIAEIRVHEADHVCVWRNRPTLIDASDVTQANLELRIYDTGSNPGLTWFNVWFYQPS